MQNSSSAAANVIADLQPQGEEEFRMISQKRVLIFASIIILSFLLSSLLSGCCGLFPLPKPELLASQSLSFGDTLELGGFKEQMLFWGYTFVDMVQVEGEVSFQFMVQSPGCVGY